MQTQLILLLLFLPLAQFLGYIFFNQTKNKNWIVFSLLSQAFLLGLTVYLYVIFKNTGPISNSFVWFSLSDSVRFFAGYSISVFSVWMLMVVQFISLFVHIYSVEYKKNDSQFYRYFAYLGIFIFAMNGLLLSNNLLITFIFWELVGFASYLLIGFWFDKPKAVSANKKAFLTNRIADVFFLIGIMLLWANTGTLQFEDLKTIYIPENTAFWSSICIFIGCMGKSAQFPFQLWLPDAMEGPTPVSALIHAATMVAAGVFLMVNMAFLCHPEVLQFIAIIGTLTAITGSIAALSQFDLKRVLAFSTISQLGFMMAAIGLGNANAAFVHLIIHAFFKAGLFLSAGAVIHAMHHAHDALPKANAKYHFDKQDIRNMGGLLKIIPTTSVCFIICGLALIGVPFFSGFMSKGAILTTAFSQFNAQTVITIGLFLSSFLTAIYVSKTIFITFFGQLKIKNLLENNQIILHENRKPIVIALVVLALFSISFNPVFELLTTDISSLNIAQSVNYFTTELLAILAILVGVSLSFYIYIKKPVFKTFNALFKPLFYVSYNHFYLDKLAKKVIEMPTLRISYFINQTEQKVVDYSISMLAVSQVVLANVLAWFDGFIIDGSINLGMSGIQYISQTIKNSQTGKVQSYLIASFVIFILIILFLSMML